MEMYFSYCIDATADEPIMLVNRQIGASYTEEGEWDGVPYIDGARFQEEILCLDMMGKKRIQVWINSEGGSVLQGMNIFNAIIKSRTPVDTYNVGVAASIAGALFMAGRKRIMSDYAQFMMHPVSGGDTKSMDAFKTSIATMLSAKCGIEIDTIMSFMDVTTWMDANKCKDLGISTDTEVTSSLNKKFVPNTTSEIMPYADKLINKLITKNKNSKMTKVTNKLNLTEGSNEDVILGAIDKLINVKNQSEEIATELQEKLTIAQQEASAANEKIAELQTQLDAITLTAKEAEELSAETIASEMVNKFTAKIGNKTETIATWVKLAKADLEGTKNLLEELPLNKVANKIDSVQSQTNIVGTYAQSKMLEIANKHNQK